MWKTRIAIVALTIGVIAMAVYLLSKPPPGVEAKGPEATTALVALATGVVSLLTSLAAFATKILEMRARRQDK